MISIEFTKSQKHLTKKRAIEYVCHILLNLPLQIVVVTAENINLWCTLSHSGTPLACFMIITETRLHVVTRY